MEIIKIRYTLQFVLDLHLQNFLKTYYILYHYEIYFSLKFPPSSSKTKAPRYSADLIFGTLQQTEVQHFGRMVRLFYELMFLLERFLLNAQYQHQKLMKQNHQVF